MHAYAPPTHMHDVNARTLYPELHGHCSNTHKQVTCSDRLVSSLRKVEVSPLTVSMRCIPTCLPGEGFKAKYALARCNFRNASTRHQHVICPSQRCMRAVPWQPAHIHQVPASRQLQELHAYAATLSALPTRLPSRKLNEASYTERQNQTPSAYLPEPVHPPHAHAWQTRPVVRYTRFEEDQEGFTGDVQV